MRLFNLEANRPTLLPLPFLKGEGLDFGHSGSVNPQGCQRVAGGRRGVWGRPPGKGAEKACTPAGVPDSSLSSLLEIGVSLEN